MIKCGVLFLVVGFALGCNQKSLSRAISGTAQDSQNDSLVGEGNSREAIADDQVVVSGSESVVIPTPITGAYLSCVHEERENAADPSNQDEVFCSVRNLDTRNLVDIYNLNVGVLWSFQGLENIRLKVETELLTNHLQHHVRYIFRNLTVNEKNELYSESEFVVEFKQTDLLLAKAKTKTKGLGYKWLRLDGGSLPAGGFAAGTEQMALRTLYLCRIYVGTGLYPGKLIEHYNDPNKSACFAVAADIAIESQSTDASALLYSNDILILPDERELTKFRWIAAKNGQIPTDAFAAGYTQDGSPLYVCRNREFGPPTSQNEAPNDPNGELTPGHISGGMAVCTHEYWGVSTSNIYEVLVYLQ